MEINIKDVDIYLGGIQILHEINTYIDQGNSIGLIGPNGSGKTSLLRTINGILQPGSGSIYIDGKNISEFSSKEISRYVGTLPQNTSLSFNFEVRKIVEMGRYPHTSRFQNNLNSDIVDNALEKTNIGHLSNRKITDVSGGERQRVLLARALAQQTPILLLDEPTTNLDINHQIQTLDIVHDLVEDENKTVISAIHDLDLAARYCDQLLLLSEGKIVDSGEPSSVLNSDIIDEVFNSSSIIFQNPITGTPIITAFSIDEKYSGNIHLLGGGNTSCNVLSKLIKGGYNISVGPIIKESMEESAAKAFGCETITVDPFEKIDQQAYDYTVKKSKNSDITVFPVEAIDIGKNLEIAKDVDPIVLVGNKKNLPDRFSDTNVVKPNDIVDKLSSKKIKEIKNTDII